MLVIERKFSCNKSEENDTNTPYIGLGALVSFSPDDLWTGIMWRAAAGLELCVRRLKCSHSPICNLDKLVLSTVNKDVLGLEVSVSDRKGMAV